VERVRYGRVTALGFASGAVAGLVAITPAAANLTPVWSVVLGLLAGALCAYAISRKFQFRYDDARDVVGIHMVGGVIGSLALGLFASSVVGGVAPDGVFFGGSPMFLLVQFIAVAATTVYSFAVTWVIAKVIDLALGFRIPEHVETNGLDAELQDRKSTRLNSSHVKISYAVFC